MKHYRFFLKTPHFGNPLISCHTRWTLLTFMLRVQAFRLSIWSFQRKKFRYTKFRIRKRAHTVGRVTKYLLLSVHCTQTTTLMFACVCGVCGYPHICPLQPAPMAVWRLKEKGEIAPSPSKTTPPANRLQAINSLINSFLPSCPLTPIKAAGLTAPSPFLPCLKSTHTHQRHKLTPCLQTLMGDGYWKPVTNLRNIWKCWVRNFHFGLEFLFVRRYLSSVLQGDVTGWTSSTRNKIIQFHALLILLWKVFLCVPVRFNVERVHWGFSEAISPQKTMISNAKKIQILKL